MVRFVWRGQERGDGDDRPRCREAGGTPACAAATIRTMPRKTKCRFKKKNKTAAQQQQQLCFNI